MTIDLGKKIKTLRLASDLTQEELANRARLTKGFISQIENGGYETSISLESLSDLVDALGISLSEFFKESKEEQVVYSTEDRIPVEIQGAEKFELLVPGSTHNIMDPINIIIPANQQLEKTDPHPGEQFGYVVKGQLTLIKNKKVYKIRKNCCFYFTSDQPYQFKNSTSKPVEFLLVVSPPQM